MPLPNSVETQWAGYLVENAGGKAQVFLESLRKLLDAREMPKVSIEDKRINMWWRGDSPCMDVRSKIDGEILATIHAMDYGTSLFVGIAFAATSSLGNYYKRMAGLAFLESIDRATAVALAAIAEESGSSVKSIERAGKFGT